MLCRSLQAEGAVGSFNSISQLVEYHCSHVCIANLYRGSGVKSVYCIALYLVFAPLRNGTGSEFHVILGMHMR